ncbi:chemotaxis protein CheY [Spirochaetia bacterium]|nr:chemotaxis protein CheY [Spirochaetia bacterium]
MTVLIVDDSRFARNILKSYLNEMPGVWDVFEAADGDEALHFLETRYAEEGTIDLILLDWNMPNMSGIEFLKKIKAQDIFKDINVIIVTSDGAKKNVIEAIKEGAADFLIKQVDPVILREKVINLFQKKHTRR